MPLIPWWLRSRRWPLLRAHPGRQPHDQNIGSQAYPIQCHPNPTFKSLPAVSGHVRGGGRAAKDLQQAENEARGEIVDLNSGLDRIAHVANSAAEKEASATAANRCVLTSGSKIERQKQRRVSALNGCLSRQANSRTHQLEPSSPRHGVMPTVFAMVSRFAASDHSSSDNNNNSNGSTVRAHIPARMVRSAACPCT